MLKINQFKIHITQNLNEKHLIKKLSDKLKIDTDEIICFKILKKSLDARKKPELFYTYSFAFDLKSEKIKKSLLNNKKYDISIYKENLYYFPSGIEREKVKEEQRPVIIGAGPAGLLCAYFLSENGYKPILIERGEDVDNRIKTVNEFWNNNKLNSNSNIQFGEGGAGTFSDGKLQTGVKDNSGRIKKVLEIFVENGANDNILYESKPHIGTDMLTTVVKNIRKKIIDNGGEVRFDSLLTGFSYVNCQLTELVIKDLKSNKDYTLKTSRMILAIGHSSRDTFKLLNKNSVNMQSKPFAVGFRVIHPQKSINESQYGSDYPDFLPAADYKLTYKAKDGRGVYSFCMCPGGYVVNASSIEGKVCVNGMSYSDRDSLYANSAIIITIDNSVYGNDLFSGMNFQEELETKTFELCHGLIPIQTLGDYKESLTNSCKSIDNTSPVNIELSNGIKGGYNFTDISNILPSYLANDIAEAFEHFGKIIDGYNNNDTILAAIETRTSSPLKILRDESFQSNIKGIYPCGEGAGYAGGIISAAVDGIKVAEKVAMSYNA